jgi:hypothetical protein
MRKFPANLEKSRLNEGRLLPVRPNSGRAVSQQHWNAINDRVTPSATGAAHDLGIERQCLMADRTGEPAEVFGLKGSRGRSHLSSTKCR